MANSVQSGTVRQWQTIFYAQKLGDVEGEKSEEGVARIREKR